MPWHGSRGFEFDLLSIARYAPTQSGVYGLYFGNTWVYIGGSDDIHASLLEHRNARGTCIDKHMPSRFVFEVVPAKHRVIRQRELIAEFAPACN